MMKFFVTQDFIKSLEMLDEHCQSRVKEKLKFFGAMENPLVFAKKLQGYKDVFRFRVGEYRIVFRLKEGAIFLLLVRHRKDIYEGI